MKTKSIKQAEITHDWWVADAQGQTLGRFASKIAQVLRGKHKTNFTPHMDMGDCVVVINAKKIRLSGKKDEKKDEQKKMHLQQTRNDHWQSCDQKALCLRRLPEMPL